MSKVITESIENAAGYRTDAVHLIETQTASSSATIDFVLPSGYYKFVIVFTGLAPATDNVGFWMRTSTDGGSTFDSGAGAYSWAHSIAQAASVSYAGSNADTELVIKDGSLGNATNETSSGSVSVLNPSAATYTHVTYEASTMITDGTIRQLAGAGFRASAADVDAIRFLMSSGNIASGTFKLYGWQS